MLSVAVEQGDEVEKGALVCVIEAMKMENEISAPASGTLEELKPGMVFTIEPMINAGRREIREMTDGWTIVTKDRSLSAQWEHTVLVTETGFEVMTLSAGSPAQPAFVNQ